MRVLHIGKYFPPCPGGIENVLRDLMLGLAGRGVTQAALVHHHERGRPTACETVAFPPGGSAEVWRVRSYGRMLYAPVAPSFGQVLEAVARSFRPDLVHVHVPNTSALWLLRSRALRDVPWLVQWHADILAEGGEALLNLAYRAYQPLERALLRRAAAVLIATEAYLASSVTLRPWAGKCVVVPIGLDPARLTEAAAAPGPRDFTADGALKVLFVGRLTYYKGVADLIEAVRRTGGVELIVAGSGEKQRQLAALAATPALRSRVRLAGHVSDGEKNRLLAEADVLCLPSVSRHEAYGLVLAEAMALGTPVIATRVQGSGISWVVGDEGAGWLVPPRDPGALASLLAGLRDHPERLAPAGRAARRRFEAALDVNAVAAEVRSVYQGLLARVPAGEAAAA
jgi:rhamnosyl/mannosyltransferase